MEAVLWRLHELVDEHLCLFIYQPNVKIYSKNIFHPNTNHHASFVAKLQNTIYPVKP